MTNFEKQNVEWNMVESEIERIYAHDTPGEQWQMVREDMKQWAIKIGLIVPYTIPYSNIVKSHAEARGWTQEGFTGMEIYDPFWDWVRD